ncbi:MAG: tryptophan-rich sensory protein, partial [Chloroflexi bacterium]|nr:tryptophan-rich sensory protein [Chloroflexota bacterium]
MSRDTIRQVANILMYLVTIVVNGLANALPFNGQTTGAISDKFPVYFVPAGYVFSIWGVIYLLLLAFTIYQALPSQKQNETLRRIGYLPALSGLLNSAWIPLWHYEQFPLTVLVMLALLLTLIAIYVRLDIGRAQVSGAMKWLVQVPFSVYLGWITVATVANVTDLLYYLKWDGFGINPIAWGVIMLIVAAGIVAAVIVTRRDIAYTLVILWAYAGI